MLKLMCVLSNYLRPFNMSKIYKDRKHTSLNILCRVQMLNDNQLFQAYKISYHDVMLSHK